MPDCGALSGTRVLDLADESGVYCTKLLADMGADVIKIEPPGGCAMRTIGPFCGDAENGPATPESNRSLFFWHYNTNKRSVTLDLESTGGRARLARLAAGADVLVETFPPGDLDARGLGYQTLTACNPRLIVVSITPFGQSGPYCHYRGSDLVAQATGGMVYVNGAPDEPPLQGWGLQAYHSASIYAAIGTLLALFSRELTGGGQWVDVSLQECVTASVEHANSFFHQFGTIAERHGSLHWTRDFRVGRCRDGNVLHCTLGDWTSLIEWVKADGKAQDLGDPAWDDVSYRRDRCAHLFDVLDHWSRELTVTELIDGAQQRRLAYAPVLPPQTLPHNPQLIDRGFFVPVQHAELGRTISYPGAPYVFSRTPWCIRRRPPLPGEHTAEVLAGIDTNHTRDSGRARDEDTVVRQPDTELLPLAGVRVVDFTWVVAGPVATRILADHGAEVIKVERRDALDFGNRRGGFSGNLNRSKRSIVINMNAPQGVSLARQLIASADVVIDNFSARVMDNWGLDTDSIRRLQPKIITVGMSGFGRTGPWRERVSYGPTLQALAGYTALMRQRQGPAVGWGYSYSDMTAGSSAALAVLIALRHRQRTGEGQDIDLSQFENLCTLLGPGLLHILVNDGAVLPIDNRSQERPSCLHGVFRCADLHGSGPARDRWCAIAVFDDHDWRRFCHALGDPAWAHDARFATAPARAANRTALAAGVEAWTRSQTAEAVMTRLQEAGVAAGIVANAHDLCRRDPQLQARHYWVQVSTREGDPVELDGVPFKMSHTSGCVRRPGPLLGEDTDAVLQQVLGLSPDTVARLRATDVIA